MLSLYIHLPFCRSKCRYCDFVSYAGLEKSFNRYTEAVLKEAGIYKGLAFDTVFFGGGTPSLLSAMDFFRLYDGLFQTFTINNGAEITVECNPESLTLEKAKMYAELGINRLSIGLQSAVDAELAMLGRCHRYHDFLRAYEAASRFFKNINIDIISGLPGQTAKDFDRTVNAVLKLRPEHVSAYSLIVEENTPLYNDIKSGVLKPISEDDDRKIYENTVKSFSAAGYEHYEISNYALPGFRCRHNSAYWKGTDYIGLGAAAHSLFKGCRYANPAEMEQYLSGIRPQQHELSLAEAREELIMLRLRLSDGIDLDEYRTLTGSELIAEKTKEIQLLTGLNLIQINGRSLRLTETGFNVADSIILKLL